MRVPNTFSPVRGWSHGFDHIDPTSAINPFVEDGDGDDGDAASGHFEHLNEHATTCWTAMREPGCSATQKFREFVKRLFSYQLEIYTELGQSTTTFAVRRR